MNYEFDQGQIVLFLERFTHGGVTVYKRTEAKVVERGSIHNIPHYTVKLTAEDLHGRSDIVERVPEDILEAKLSGFAAKPVNFDGFPALFGIHAFIRLVKLHVIWRVRSTLHCHPLPRRLEGWDPTPLARDDTEQLDQEMFEKQSHWLYLEGFFQLKGYTMFKPVNRNFDKRKWNTLIPNPHQASSKARCSEYPYARKGYTEEPLQFYYTSMRVWPVRDDHGNDLVIRLVSDSEISDELRIWRRLHSPGIKNHPRNRVIPVLEYLEFDGLIFIVMPWWDSPAFSDYATAEEILNMAECILDTVDFFHEHRIVHRDIAFQNIRLNVIIDKNHDFPKGHHDPKEALYTIIDFGFSLIYPYETPLEEVTTTLRYGCEVPSKIKEYRARNPFTLETHYTVKMIEGAARVVEKFIPEIGPFFDDILNVEEANRPFAREVLQRFRQLKASLTPEQLHTPVQDRYWKRVPDQSTRVWPARDCDGNDLIIRLVSDNEISDELRIWRRLHAPGVKNHPRNRAIPVIEYLEFDGLTFIVMPRCDSPADNDYATAEEVLNMAECIFDSLDFLHEHRIVHRDLDFQNIGLNVVINSYDMQEGHHNPKEAMYAIIDFGFSLIYPYETQLEEAITTLRYGWEIGEVQPPRNPFTLETHYVVKMMQQHVRVIEKFVPEIGRFFDDILNAEEADRPFAHEA
ncbi:hypothetical protein CVT24_012887 [Panaeolus cyanescens]|uniref:Protein kinase domain-containing protein n=1 Tax=Panaeolus cyanescens TaxID=181874 RepID=A0A409WKV0_9AGAR|nr:hypothetical protein CVT24_012887 [Panaeolus cyanescens]